MCEPPVLANGGHGTATGLPEDASNKTKKMLSSALNA